MIFHPSPAVGAVRLGKSAGWIHGILRTDKGNESALGECSAVSFLRFSGSKGGWGRQELLWQG